MKISTKKQILKQIRSGVRLNVKPPKRETPKNVYTRKNKYKGSIDTSFIFVNNFSNFLPVLI